VPSKVFSTLARLATLWLVVTGCSGATSEPAVVDLLPNTLGGVRLVKESFSGADWLETRPESSSAYFGPELRPDARTFLRRLDKSPDDLTVAWALAREGIQVIAYRVRGARPSQLVDAYLSATAAAGRARPIEVAGRNVTLITATLPQRGFVHAYGDVLYAANSYHVDGSELEELVAKLPGDRPAQWPLGNMLPTRLRGVRLKRETFRGRVWLRAAPEKSFQPEVDLDVARFLALLHRPIDALTAAWAIAPEGPKVVAYRVTAVGREALTRSFVQATDEVRTTQRRIAGKRIIVTSTDVPGRLGYLYASRGTLFVAGTNHLGPGEVEELLSKLPD
jgi:hypothetical protein